MAPDPCQSIVDAIDRLYQELRDREDDLLNATGQEITLLRSRMKVINVRIKDEEATLERCRKHPPQPTPPQPTFSTIMTVPPGGVVVTTDNSSAPGPFTNNNVVIIPLIFNLERTVVTVFPLINIVVQKVTVQQASGIMGSFDKNTGSMDLPSIFQFNTSLGGAQLSFPFPGLTTETALAAGRFKPTGSRLDGAGNITIVGASTTTGNILFGNTNVQVTITGLVAPLP